MSWTPSTGIEAYVVVPPQYSEQIYAGINSRSSGNNLRCVLTTKSRENATVNRFRDGTSEKLSFGPDRWDMEISFQIADRDTAILVERIKRLNIPVYIYPRVGGTMQFSMPLIRGLGTDPVDTPTITNAHSVTDGTTMNLPRACAGIGEKMFPVSDSIALIHGIPNANNNTVAFPFDHGLGIFKSRENLLKYSSLNSIAHTGISPTDGWDADAGTGGTWDTDMGSNDSPWCAGESTFWTTNTNVILRSYKFDVSSLTKDPLFSCYAMVNGSATARIMDSSGGVVASKLIPAGSGRFQVTFTGITPGSYTNFRMEFVLSSGDYMEIGQVQLISPGAEQITEYLPYLSTDSNMYGELSDDGIAIADMIFRNNYQRPESTVGSRDNALAVSAFWQVGFSSSSENTKNTLLFMEHYTSTSISDIELRFGWNVSTFEFAIYSGGVRRAGTDVASFEEGDVFSLALCCGNDGTSTNSKIIAVNMRTNDIYEVESTSSSVHVVTRLFVGCRSTAGYQCDGIMGGVSVDSMPYSSLKDWVTKLGNTDIMDISRRTAGRWYHLTDNTTIRPLTRRAYEGSFILEESRAI